MKLKEYDLLIITQYYPPDITAAAFRWGDLNELLIEQGVKTQVITTEPHKGVLVAAKTHNPDIKKIKLRREYNILMRLYNMIYFFMFVTIHITFGRRTYKNILCSSPPITVGILCVFLKFFTKSHIVLDVRDLWPQSAVDLNKLKVGSILHKILLRFERAMYDSCDEIICVSNSMMRIIRSRSSKKVSVVFNGVRLTKAPSRLRVRHKQRSLRYKVQLCYAGNLGYAQDLLRFLELFSKSTVNKEFVLHIVGGGAQETLCRRFVEANKLSNVRFHGLLSKEDCSSILQNSDVLLLPLQKGLAFSATIPSKVFDYLYLKKPILTNVTDEALEILQRHTPVSCFDDTNTSLDNALESLKNDFHSPVADSSTFPAEYTREFQADFLKNNVFKF